MNPISRMSKSVLRSGEVGFVAVVLASFISAISTIGYVRQPFTSARLVILTVASLAYLIAGTYGFARVRRAASLIVSLAYFAVQLLLAATITYLLPSGAIYFLMLPLVGQSVTVQPFRWTFLVSLVTLSILVVPLALRGGVLPAVIIGFIYFAAIVFVVAFAQIAVNERHARAEVERLAAELSAANHQLREYAAKVEELATAKERNRLAREIHDSLGHYLTVINVQLEAARAVIDRDGERARDVLGKAQSLTQEGLNEVRRSVAALRTAPTTDRPLPEILAALVDECRVAGVEAGLTLKGEPRSLSPQAELALYRAAQEGLTNVRKHARAAQATVTLTYEPETVLLTIEDDGVGCAAAEEGFGLLGIRERATLLSGGVRIHTAEGRGFRLEVEVRA